MRKVIRSLLTLILIKCMNGLKERIDTDDSDIFTAWDGNLFVGCLVGMVYYPIFKNTSRRGLYLVCCTKVSRRHDWGSADENV